MTHRTALAALGTGQRQRVGTATKKEKRLLTQSLDKTLAAHRYLEKFLNHSDEIQEEELAVLAIMAVHQYAQNILGPRAASEVWKAMDRNNPAH